MNKSTHDKLYRQLCENLISLRKLKSLSQAELSHKLRKPQSFVSKIENYERRIDILELLEILNVLGQDPTVFISNLLTLKTNDLFGNTSPSILEKWDITLQDLSNVIYQNPSLGGMIIGYLAEYQLKKKLSVMSQITNIIKYDDHDRKKKGDLFITYKGKEYSVEVKSLQTNSIKRDGATRQGKAQCDASDRRKIKLPNGSELETTCLKVGEFDILAICIFGFDGKWDFVFAHNRDLPRTTWKKYPEKDRKYLLASLVSVEIPIKPPFTTNILDLLRSLE